MMVVISLLHMSPNMTKEWPICTFPGCEEEVNPKRVSLIGKVRCLRHGDPRKQYTVASAYNKGGLQLITHGDIEDIGK